MGKETKNADQISEVGDIAPGINQLESEQMAQAELEKLKIELSKTNTALKNEQRDSQDSKLASEVTIQESVDLVKEAATAVQGIADKAETLAKKAEEQAASAAMAGTTWEEIAASSDKNNQLGFFIGVGAALIISGAVFWGFLFERLTELGGLDVFASAVRVGERSSTTDKDYEQQIWRISGNVVGKETGNAPPEVFVILTDSLGNQFSAFSTAQNFVEKHEGEKSKAVSFFDISLTQLFSTSKNATVNEIVVSAIGKGSYYSTIRGKKTLDPDLNKQDPRWTKASGKPFLASMILFLVAFILSLSHTGNQLYLRAAYYAIVVIALAFTVAMIVFISTASQELAASKDDKTVISLGFAHVFFGSYIGGSDSSDWLLSLTTPPETRAVVDSVRSQSVGRSGDPDQGTVSSSEPFKSITTGKKTSEDLSKKTPNLSDRKTEAIKGFGAPLWIILLAVVGSAVFMIKLLVDSLKKPVSFSPILIRARMAEIVRYQVYIFFAPLGAIFVYQLLVAAGSASEPITLGFAALAAGIGLNNLLEKAWKGAESALKS